MTDKPGSSSGFLFLLAGLGVASTLAVVLALYVFSQRSGSDSAFANNNYLQVQQTVAITTIRKAMAEEFVDTVVDCISPKTLKDQILTEQEVTERVAAVLENFSVSINSRENQKCENGNNYAWTFTLPCRLTINRPPAWMDGTLNLGHINICGTTIAAGIHSGLGGCATSASFAACLVRSVLANNDVQKEINDIVDLQNVDSK
ncbi:MAG TPA: hypothetical protein VLZ74_07765 [Methylocella sp.]|nr:hypothetical protein [Methylocella sp.]